MADLEEKQRLARDIKHQPCEWPKSAWPHTAGSRTAVDLHLQISTRLGSRDNALEKTNRQVGSPQSLTLCLEFAPRVMPMPESSRLVTSQ